MFLDEKMLEILYRIRPDQSILKSEVLSLYYTGYAQTLVEFIEKAYEDQTELLKTLDIDKLKTISHNISTQESFEDFMAMLVTIEENDPLVGSRFEHVQELYNDAIIKARIAKLAPQEINNLNDYINQKFQKTEDILYAVFARYLKQNKLQVSDYMEVEGVEETAKV